MEMRSLLMWLAYFLVIWTAYEADAHPKSWLTTIKPRPNATVKPRSKTAIKTRLGTTPKPRPRRSVDEADVTFFPGLAVDIKGESREFLTETQSKEDGEEEVFIRLLQEEEEQSTEGPDEQAARKRLTMQMKTPSLDFQGTLETIEVPSETVDFPSETEVPSETVDFPSETTGVDYSPEETQGENPEREYFESTTFSAPGMESAEFENDDTPLSNELVPSLVDPYDLPARRHYGDHSLHHDTDVNLRRPQNPNQNPQAVLLHRMLNSQNRKAPEDPNFLKENEEERTNIINREYTRDGDVLSEAQLNWEEYHEYDA